MGGESWHFDTQRIHAGYDPAQHNHAVSVPIYQTTAFTFESTAHADELFHFDGVDPTYTRLANPTVAALEQRVSALHGGRPTIALASGMAAVSDTLLNVAGSGGRVLTTDELYGGTVDALAHLYPELGVGIDVASDAHDPAAFEAAITPATRAIYVETVANPLLAVADLRALADVAHAHGIPLIVDNTVPTPYLLNPFDFGVDVVVYSATKGLSGHGNVIAGLVVESGQFDYAAGHHPQFTAPLWFLRGEDDQPRSILQVFPDAPFTGRLRAVYLNYLGAALGPFDAYLTLLGIETLSERVDKQVANAAAVARYLESSPHASWVAHPSAPDYPYRELAERYLPRGLGPLVSFGFRGTEAQKRRFIESTRVFSYQVNIGDARSLITNPAETTHAELTEEQRRRVGLGHESIRLSLGLEDPADLVADLDQAFAAAFA